MLPAGAYRARVLPAGFSVHWLRLRSREAGTLTAEIVYN